jgi:hypothetical protein
MRPANPIEMRRRVGLALGLALSCVAAGHASAGVETLTFGGNGQNGPCDASYNYGVSGGHFASIYGSCSYSVNSTGTVATGDQSYVQGATPGNQLFTNNQFQGALDPPGKVVGSATSSFDRSSVTISGPGGYSSVSTGYAAANLADGTVHASAVANLLGDDAANALETDNLHFTVAGATASSVTDITAQFTLDGNFAVGNPTGNQASLLWQTGLGSSGVQVSYAGINGIFQLYNFSQSGSVKIIKNTPQKIVYDATMEIDGASAVVPITQNLYLGVDSGWALNYQNTGTIKLILPPGVTYTSDSGVFLTGASAVPEPTTWALMLAGFGGLGAALRVHRRSAGRVLA